MRTDRAGGHFWGPWCLLKVESFGFFAGDEEMDAAGALVPAVGVPGHGFDGFSGAVCGCFVVLADALIGPDHFEDHGIFGAALAGDPVGSCSGFGDTEFDNHVIHALFPADDVTSGKMGGHSEGQPCTIGVPKIGVPKSGSPKIGSPKIGVPKIGVPKIGVLKIGVLKIGVLKIGVLKIGSPKIGSLKIGSPKIGVPKIGSPKIGVPKIGVLKIGALKIGVPKIGVLKIGVPKIGAAEVGPGPFRFVI